jgi:hypothetical protein
VRQLRLEDIIKWFGIATIADIARLQAQIDEANRRFQIEIDKLREKHHKTTNGFANYKRKTDEELKGFVTDVNLILASLELLLKTAHTDLQSNQIKRMIIALKIKKGKAQKGIASISLANSSSQIDVALAGASNG